jgi:alkylated DNA repair dioxygenase AlkB
LQLRPREGDGPPTFELKLERRSLFVLAGEARRDWQHRIPAVQADRYSLTVRAAARLDAAEEGL